MEDAKKVYKNFRQRLEEFLKKRHSKKVAQEMESFYERNFADKEVEQKKIMGKTTIEKPNDIGAAIDKIEDEARKLNIPVREMAGFCFENLLSDATYEFLSTDYDMVDGDSHKSRKKMIEISEKPGTMDLFIKTYNVALYKIQGAEAIAEKFNLGDDEVEICERNIHRLENRVRLLKSAKDEIESGRSKKAAKAIDELKQLYDSQKSQIVKEEKALLKEDVSKWMKE